MKRMTAILLTVILLISLVPLSANAASKDTAETSAASVERKFQLLLEDLELVENVHQSDRYFYEEIGQYPAKDPEWVLIRGGLIDLSAKNNVRYRYATIGNKLLRANINSSPFRLGYGIYDFKTGVFYDILDAWNMNLNNLRDVWDDLTPAEKYSAKDKSAENAMYTIGDADVDGKVTILDATRIQRCIAELDENPWEKFAETGSEFIRGAEIAGATDYDRDGSTTVMDATRIQRGIAELPNILSAKIILTRSAEDHGTQPATQMINSHSDADKFVKAYTGESLNSALLPNEDFRNIMIAGVYLKLNDTAVKLTLGSAQIDSNGVLNLNFRAESAEKPTGEASERLVLVQMSNTFVDDIKQLDFNLEYLDTNSSVYTVIPRAADQMAPPDDLSAQGYTKLTTTGIPISTQSMYNVDLSGSPLEDFRNGKDYIALIRTRSEFERFFPGFDTDGTYDDAFFKDNAIIGMIGMSLGMEGKPEIGIAATKDNTLYIEAGMQYPDYGDTIPTAVPMDVPDWTFRCVDKRLVERVTEITVWDNKNSSAATVRAEIPWYNYFEIPTDITSEGYQSINAAEIAVSSPSWDQFNWNNTPLTASRHGYVLLLRSRREFEKYFPGFDKEKKYGDAYFKENAIVAALVQGNDYSSAAYLNTFAVKGANLYTSAGYTDNYETDEEGTPIAQPIERLVHTFRQVKQSDVASVTHISLWTPPSPAYNKDLPFTICDDHPVQGYYSETNAAEHIISKPAVTSALRKLYVDEEGNRIERDDYTFNAENYTDSDFSTSSLIGMRVFQGSSSTKLSVDRVYRSGSDELTVDITRKFAGSAINPDMNWRMIFLRINNYRVGGYSRRFTVKLNVQVVENTGLIAPLTPAAKRYDESYIISHASDYNYITAEEIETVDGSNNLMLDYADFNVETPAADGCVMLLRNKAEFDYRFGEINTKSSYSDSFFEDTAVIAVLGRGNDSDATATLTNLAVTDGGRMLYTDARIDYPHPDLGAVANEPFVWTLYWVDQSDVENVSDIGLWNSDSMIREIVPERPTMNFIKTSNEDRCRALDSTAIDIEPKSGSARYHLSYSSHNLPGSMYANGYIMMIKDKATLNRYFPAELFNTEAYTDAYFKDNAIIAMVSKGGEDTARAELKAPAIIGEQLYIDADVSYHPYFSSDGMEAEQPSSPTVWAFRQVKKSDISGVKSFAFWNSEATVEPIYYRNGHIPDPTSENVKDIKTTAITMSAPSESDFSWKPLGSSDNGYVLILGSRTALEYYLPGFDKEKQYNDAFFKDNAIIAAVLKGNDHTSAAQFGKIGMINQTLFVNAYFINNNPVDDEGTPIAQPTSPTIRAFRKVSKEDISKVGNIQFWHAPAED